MNSVRFYWVTIRPLLEKILLGLVAVVALLYGYSLYEPQQQNISSDDSDSSQTLSLEEIEAERGEELVLDGKIYFTAVNPEDDLPYTYAYDVAGDYIEKVTDIAFMTEFEYVNEYESYLTMVTGEETDPDNPEFVRPAFYNSTTTEAVLLNTVPAYNEMGITYAISEEPIYAWSEQAELVGLEENGGALEHWQVRIGSTAFTEEIIFEDAAHPVFAAGNEVVVFAREDGVYGHNLFTGESRLMSNAYSGLSIYDEFDITQDGKYLVLAMPSLGIVSLQQLDTQAGAFYEYYAIVAEEGTYSSPQLSLNGDFYAVVRTEDAATYLEIRTVHTDVLVQEEVLSNDIQGPFALEDWVY